MRVFEYDLGVLVAEDVEDGSAIVTEALGGGAAVLAFPESLMKTTNGQFTQTS